MRHFFPFYKTLPIAAVCLALVASAAGPTRATTNDQPRPRVIFVHRSVGANLIAQGNVRALFAAAGFDFWDHGYNADGLVGPEGNREEPGFDLPDDNTDPDGYAAIFAQPEHHPADNALSYLLTYDIIVFKSCYPISDIDSDEVLKGYKEYYRSMRAVMDRHPEKLFVVVTAPPNWPGGTSPDRATRGREFANWLKSDEYLKGHPNITAFDLFDALADKDNLLKENYRLTKYPVNFGSPSNIPSSLMNILKRAGSSILRRPTYRSDSHPNSDANRTVGPKFVQSIVDAHRTFASSSGKIQNASRQGQ